MSHDPMAAGRLPLVPSESDDPGLAAIFGAFRDRGREPPILYRTLANAPAMLQAWADLAWPLRSKGTTPRGLRELIIMRVAQLTNAEAEWLAHFPMAVQSGVTEQQLAELSTWRNSDRFSDKERAVLAYTDELTVDIEASDTTFAALAAHFEPGAVVELTLTAAFYNCVSRVLRSLGLRPADGDDPRLSHLGGQA